MDRSHVPDALFTALGWAVLERTAPHGFTLLAEPPSWYREFFPSGDVGEPVDLGARFPFLEHFFVDAEPVWTAEVEQAATLSGLWLEARPNGDPSYLEAIAARVTGRALLLIECTPVARTPLQQTVQRGREQNLALRGALRVADDLQRERLHLQNLVADQDARLVDSAARLDTESRALARVRDQLRHAVKIGSVGRLAGGVAHDFNNFITAILGHCEIALDEIEEASPARPHLALIRQEAERAAALTRQLLMFSRQEISAPAVLDLRRVVDNINQLLRRLIGESIRLDIDVAPDVWPVIADTGQLEQLIMNLAVNARDAMPKGGTLWIASANRTVDTPLAAVGGVVAPGDYVVLEVRDTGIGIEPELLDQVFEPFFTTKAATQGTGLGLSVVYSIVQQNLGHVCVRSSPGQGTAFTVFLPRAMDAPQAAPAPGTQAMVPGGHETVLLVEDEDAVRALLVELLNRGGYRVLAAADASDARRLSERHAGSVDLLVTDVVLPSENGRVLAESLRRDRPGLPVLFMSGYTDDVVLRHGLVAESTAFLQKPFVPSVFLDEVRRCLDRRPR